ncbi:hypothetical protein VNO77_04593 [Canavalia gladiata]|uniref:Uncharacterized protein n=1 Tax=Canavalia gladiata TaxID=3824 RepID=A0AAN9RDC5_CANGL
MLLFAVYILLFKERDASVLVAPLKAFIQHATAESLRKKSGASSIDLSLLHFGKRRRRASFSFLQHFVKTTGHDDDPCALRIVISLLDRQELQQRIKRFCMTRGHHEHWLHSEMFKRLELQKTLGNHLAWKDRLTSSYKSASNLHNAADLLDVCKGSLDQKHSGVASMIAKPSDAIVVNLLLPGFGIFDRRRGGIHDQETSSIRHDSHHLIHTALGCTTLGARRGGWSAFILMHPSKLVLSSIQALETQPLHKVGVMVDSPLANYHVPFGPRARQFLLIPLLCCIGPQWAAYCNRPKLASARLPLCAFPKKGCLDSFLTDQTLINNGPENYGSCPHKGPRWE